MVYDQQKFLSHSPGGLKSEIRVPAWLGSGENSLFSLWISLVTQMVKNPPAVQETGCDPSIGKTPNFSLYPYMARKSEGALQNLFCKGTNPIRGASQVSQ